MSINKITIERLEALPETLQPSTIYIVKAADVNHVELHFTNNDGTLVRRLINKNDVDNQINTAISEIHTHGNLEVLDKFTEDSNGDVKYDGKTLVTTGVVDW